MAWKPSFSPGSKRVKSNQQTTKKWNKYCNFYILEWSAQLLLCPSSLIKDFAGLHLFVETYCQLHLFFFIIFDFGISVEVLVVFTTSCEGKVNTPTNIDQSKNKI